MDERTANDLALMVNGRPWHSGGNIWLVLVDNPDGSLVVHGEDGPERYPSRAAFFGEC